MEAARGGHKEVVELLLNHGAELSAINMVRGDDDDDDDDDDHSLIRVNIHLLSTCLYVLIMT
jgi:hypothetical protein